MVQRISNGAGCTDGSSILPRSIMDRKKLGELGEKIAEKFLKSKGYEILDKNYSSKFVSGPQRGEIDIIAKNGETLSFVEVKTLFSAADSFSPEDKVDFQKQRKIVRAAESWLMEKKLPLDSQWQIDVVAIRVDLAARKAKIRHFKNVASG